MISADCADTVGAILMSIMFFGGFAMLIPFYIINKIKIATTGKSFFSKDKHPPENLYIQIAVGPIVCMVLGFPITFLVSFIMMFLMCG